MFDSNSSSVFDCNPVAEFHDNQGIPLWCLCDLVQLHLGGKSPITRKVTVILCQLLGSPSNVLVSHTTEDGDLPPLRTKKQHRRVVKPRNILQFSPRVAQKAQWEAAKDRIFLLRPRVHRSGKSSPVSCQTILGVKEIPWPEHRNLRAQASLIGNLLAFLGGPKYVEWIILP